MLDRFNLLDTFSDLSAGRNIDFTYREWIFTEIYR